MSEAEPMTAIEHAEAILKATGWGPQFFPLGSRAAILAAVEAAMQDARAEALREAEDMTKARLKLCDEQGLTERGYEAFCIGSMLRALAHKGAGDE